MGRSHQHFCCLIFCLFVAGHALAQTTLYDEADREASERIAELFEALNLAEGMDVADLGFGDGFFTIRLARAVGPTGRVYAVDVDPGLVEQLRDRAQKEGLNNIEIIVGGSNDPKLPPGGLDIVFSAYAYHEMTNHEAMLAKTRDALKTGGVLGLIDQSGSENQALGRQQQSSKHEIAPDIVVADLRQAGFEIARRENSFVLPPHGSTSTLVAYLVVAHKAR